MSVIRQSYIVHAGVGKVWEALVNPALINEWGGGPAKMSDKPGFKFSLWNGDIYGKNIEVKPRKMIVQEWVMGKSKPSRVQISLTYENQRTYIDLLHEDVPDRERDKINKGWKDFYFGPLRDWVERNNPAGV